MAPLEAGPQLKKEVRVSSNDLEVEVVYRDEVDLGKAARALLDLIRSVEKSGDADNKSAPDVEPLEGPVA